MSEVVRKPGGGRTVVAGRGRPDQFVMDEIYELIRTAVSRGMSDNEAALYAGCCAKTVFRYRKRHGIPAQTLGGRTPFG